ncbi:unnamed protein product [Rotaria sp. Silwood2]|nr:unnamed protein product [Rotaria sp. Silwood2]CAF4512732.1 unnamed protein product [Rotaria sp. Silwood2]
MAMTMNKMTLELLSNELLFDLFELFDAFNLLRAFSGLNTRFNSLLFIHFRRYRVDLRSISKEDFDIFYRTYLPSITDRTIYLRLSDDEDTPYQCAHFQSGELTLGKFNNLRSLTFDSVSSDLKINQNFFSDLHRLHHLTHLKFIDCRLFHVKGDDFQEIMNQIWNLPNLTHFYGDFTFEASSYFAIPNIISTSLQYLTIHGNDWCSYKFPRLLENVPRLRKFSTSLSTYEEDDLPLVREFIPSPKNLSIAKLDLSSINSQRLMINLFQLLPNVIHLKVEIQNLTLDGHRWEQIIVNYLPQLKILQFMMDFDLGQSVDDQIDLKKVDQYLSTYRTPFWIQHKWFIRCHWTKLTNNLDIQVYSLPYQFDCFPVFYRNLHYNTQSTCPSDMHFSYDSARNISYKSWLFNDIEFSHNQINNIKILSLILPTDHCFFSIFPKLENLYALNVDIFTENYQLQLQRLLDSAPRLFSLSFESWATSTMPPYQCTSSSIHRLDLRGSDGSRRRYRYDIKQCEELSQTPLGIQCRVLHIEVEQPVCILHLIYPMINLRTLDVSYDYDYRSNKYDMVKVLQHYLPSIWTVTEICHGKFIIRS